MPTEARLNQVVKGAPTSIPSLGQPTPLPSFKDEKDISASPDLANLPSSPPQIYLNLLILESSLRAQYLHLLSRWRLNTFFSLILSVWNVWFFYALFLRPREDGTGLGGSIYWFVEMSEKIALMGGLVTALLIWITGQWERGVRWPKRWLGTTNRGLRTFNLRVVVVRRRWWRELVSYFSFLLPLTVLLSDDAGPFSEWHLVEHENGAVIEEDLAKGGDHIMLLLLPKSFSPEFRENWEEYRSEYWGRENQRRASLRRKMRSQRRQKAREHGGWKWWTGVWRVIGHRSSRRSADLEKQPAGHHHLHPHGSIRGTLSEKDAKANRRRSLMRSESSHSRQSSRSSTPMSGDFDGISEKPLSERVRRGSSVSSTASVRRKRGEAKSGLLAMTANTDDKDKERESARKKRDSLRPRTPESEDGPKIKKELVEEPLGL
jgi:hypothetical protein